MNCPWLISGAFLWIYNHIPLIKTYNKICSIQATFGIIVV